MRGWLVGYGAGGGVGPPALSVDYPRVLETCPQGHEAEVEEDDRRSESIAARL